MQTPYFLIHEKEVASNVEAFRKALERHWPCYHIAYSVKTNSLPWLLSYLQCKGVLAEVVSAEEYELAQKCGYEQNEIVYNGPIKTAESLIYALKNGSRVNIDSASELAILCSCDLRPEEIGIRVNVDLSGVCPEDIDYHDDGFRFGFSYETGALNQVLCQIRQKFGEIPIGLHLHCNSNTRSVRVYRALAAAAAKIIGQYKINPAYIDIGGGFFGGVPGKTTPDEYIQAIRAELDGTVDCRCVRLIIEPGSAIIGSTVDLVTSVVDVKDTIKSRIVTTDGSRINLDPLWIKRSYLYSLESGKDTPMDKQIICGYTCMDHDRIMIVRDAPELSVGDKIIYHRVGAYTMTFGGPFIRYYPDVYVCSGETIRKVRSRMTVEDYLRIQS